MYLEINNLHKGFGDADSRVEVLKDISFGVEKGEICVMLGPSGSGKSTLLNILGGIESADSGNVCVGDDRLEAMSEKKLSAIDNSMIASTVTLSDMTLIYDQLKDSFGAILPLLCGFSVIIYVLLLYLLAKMVVDKNGQNISMLKILGYTSAEASRIYNYATAAVVVVALIVTTPLAERMMKVLYYIFMKKINGWMPYFIPTWMFVVIPLIGMGCYLLIHLLLSAKIRRVKLGQALRSME